MRLVLAIPETWKQEVVGAHLRAEIEPGLVLEVFPIIELPEDIQGWASQAPRLDRGDGVADVQITRSADDKSDIGWPIVVHESNALDNSGHLVQARIHVLYVLVEHGAAVAIRARDPQRLAARRDELLAVARSGRPEWGVPVGASIEDLLAT